MKILALIFLCAGLSVGQATLIAHTSAATSGPSQSTPVTTAPINTSTCTPHCMEFACVTGTFTPLPTDSLNNTWVLYPGLSQNEDGDTHTALYIAFGATTGTAQTFTVTGSPYNSGIAIAAGAFNNIASGPDKTDQAQGYNNPTTAGPVTPTNNDEVGIACGGMFYSSFTTVSGGVSILDNQVYATNTGTPLGLADAYVIQTTSAAVSAAWANPSGAISTVIGTFYSTQDPGTLTMNTTSLPEGFNGDPYSVTLQSSGGVCPCTWGQTGGTAISTLGLSLNSTTGVISGTPSTGTISSLQFTVTDSTSTSAHNATGITLTIASAALSISTTTCPAGTQYASYAGCNLSATGGTSPYTYSWSTNQSYAALPEGMTMNTSTGAITSSLIGGQGSYGVYFTVTDSLGATANQLIFFSLKGVNAWMETIFPSNSIWYACLSAACGLSVDTSPSATIFAGTHALQVFFGNTAGGNIPLGIPAIEVPYTQSAVGTYNDSSGGPFYWTTAPIPSYTPIEGTLTQCCYNGTVHGEGETDAHAIVYQESGAGNPSLNEMFNALPCSYSSAFGVGCGSNTWYNLSQGQWTNTTTNAMTAQGNGTTDAAGLPLASALVTASEVNGTGTPTSPNGTLGHLVRFTPGEHTAPYYRWPGTAKAGVGTCYNGSTPIAQGYMPFTQTVTYCSDVNGGIPTGWGPIMGEIYRLKASVYASLPACFSTSPQSMIIATGFYNHGLIVADNGSPGGLIGTPDNQWNDADLACLKQLNLSNFEAVNVGLLIQSTSSFQAGSGSGTAPGPPSCPTNTATQGQPYSSSTSSSTGTTPITYFLNMGAGGLPSGITLNGATGAITSSAVLGSGFSSFELVATNIAGNSSPVVCSINVLQVSPTIPASMSFGAAGSIQ